MKILHTSDWHVGKRLRGESRHDEHTEVLGEITEIAQREQVDMVVVAGDLFESPTPAPEASALVWRMLMDLRDTGATVVVIAGNHDNARSLESLRPLTDAAGVVVAGHVRAPDAGGVVEVEGRSGHGARVALVPFLSQRYVVLAEHLMVADAAEAAGAYAERYRSIVTALGQGFADDAVNVVVAHCFVRGGVMGGGERDAQSIETYWVDSTAFGARPHYVALGHLHRTQSIPGPCPTWYSGSPIQVDFGEGGDDKHVLVVEAAPGAPASVEPVRLQRGARLLTVTGTMAQLEAGAERGDWGDAWLRVVVEEAGRAGLADDVRRLLPRAVDIRIEREHAGPGSRSARSGRPPDELFAAYLAERDVADDAVMALFRDLYDEATTAEGH